MWEKGESRVVPTRLCVWQLFPDKDMVKYRLGEVGNQELSEALLNLGCK